MPNIVELLSGELIDIDTLEGLHFQEKLNIYGRQGWHSRISGTDRAWWWDDAEVPAIKEALLARSTATPAGFTCKYCGGHNG